MGCAAIKLASVHRCQHGQKPRHRIVRQMRIGDMALTAGHRQMAGQAATAAVLDHIAERVRVGRLADDAGIRLLPVGSGPFHHFHRAVDGIALFIAGDHQADRSAGTGFQNPRGGGDKGGDSAFHVGGTTAIETPVGNLGIESAMRPGGLVADRNHIRMAGKAQMRPAIADAGEEIVDAFIALAKGKARAGKAERCQLGLEKVERAAFMRRDRRAADQPLRQIDGMRRPGTHQSRSSSLTDVFDRVFSSTCLMITAQESDGPGDPSARGLPGSVPGTTTE